MSENATEFSEAVLAYREKLNDSEALNVVIQYLGMPAIFEDFNDTIEDICDPVNEKDFVRAVKVATGKSGKKLSPIWLNRSEVGMLREVLAYFFDGHNRKDWGQFSKKQRDAFLSLCKYFEVEP